MSVPLPPTTKAGRARLEAMLTDLREVQRPALVAATGASRSGDAVDVAGGLDAQVDLARLDERIRVLQEQLLAPPRELTRDGTVQLGSKLTLDFGDGPEQVLVGTAGDAASGAQVLTPGSALGRAVMGRNAGDRVSYTSPGGQNIAVTVTAVD